MKENTWNRKVILTTTENQKDALSHNNEGKELLRNSEIKILSMDDVAKFDDEFTILGGDRIAPNMMLVLSPYNDKTYVKIDEARAQLAVEKGLLTVRFCSLLGATSIKVIDVKQTDLDKQTEISLEGSAKGVSPEVKAEIAKIEKIKNQIEVVATARGGKPKFEKAERLLKENRLETDSFFKNLFNMVKDYEGEENRIGVLTKSVLLSHSMKDTLDIVGKVSFPVGYVKAGYKSSLKQKEQIFMTLEVSFESN
ncbi:hypothetical protein [Lutibacter flavus]|uniref:Uncharacterized protein n=1 Tax=Lutibacter flavus TaxID=691689 RepID=A0A238XKP9_9FLAO|nr:hypothetical protein [Lutibacter flavus]SNR58904.1 hypothetical protein SAMN04488111_1869 [Lutibacter flavus]